MEHFFLVADWGAHHYLDVPNVMLSAGSIANKEGTSWNFSRTRLPETVERVFLDSGGFAFFSRWGDYPFTLEDYLDLAYYIRDIHPLFKVATLDYPCEPEIDRSQFMTNEDRIQKTVANAVECVQADKTLPWMPVIQGYTLTEYLDCIEKYREVGLVLDYLAIGSVCSRKGSPFEIRKIITGIKRELPLTQLHAFGLGIPFLEDPQVYSSLYSSDSAAWNWGISGKNMRDRKKKAAIDYMLRVELLQNGFSGQTTLHDHLTDDTSKEVINE